MNPDLQELLEISHAVGNDPRLVQGGGGNTSVKTDGGRRMYVKASGTSLARMAERRGYRLVDVEACLAITRDPALERMPVARREAEVLRRLLACCLDELEGRPSVETSLHAALGRCVVHTHPSVVNGLLCAHGGRRALQRLFGEMDPPFLYIDYAGAGYTLAKRMDAELASYRRAQGRLPKVIFLENHGVFVNAETAAEALALTREIFEGIQSAAAEALAGAERVPLPPMDAAARQEAVAKVTEAMRQFYAGVFAGPPCMRFENGEVVQRFLRLKQAPELCRVSPLVPDQVVYCRERPVWVELPEDPAQIQPRVTAALEKTRAGVNTPLCLVVGGLGLFCAAPSESLLDAACATMVAILETLAIASRFGGPRGLSEEALAFLRNWEVERFRRRLATQGEEQAQPEDG